MSSRQRKSTDTIVCVIDGVTYTAERTVIGTTRMHQEITWRGHVEQDGATYDAGCEPYMYRMAKLILAQVLARHLPKSGR